MSWPEWRGQRRRRDVTTGDVAGAVVLDVPSVPHTHQGASTPAPYHAALGRDTIKLVPSCFITIRLGWMDNF
jgi:hypothetical protein